MDATDVTDVVPAPMTPDAVAAPPRRKTSRPRQKPHKSTVHEIDDDVIEELGHDRRNDVMNAGQILRTERG